MHSFKELVQKFDERLSSNTSIFNNGIETLYEPCRYFMALGGKRVRPVLCLMANELFGEINEDAWHAAMGIELFHNFTLIHDDIMDRAPLRRGKTTIHERNGLTSGILCGDVMSIYAYDQLAYIKKGLPQVLHLFNRTSIEVCEGQQLDMDFESRQNVSIEEYINMITLKTSVLLACALKMGALLGGATESTANKLYEFGKNLGIAFQLQDDYLDAYGAESGKQIGGDIKANKKTYLLLKAEENANQLQHAALQALLGRDDEAKVPAMLSLFNNIGADIACREAVTHYSMLAFQCLDDTAAPAARKQPLHELASYLLGRDK
jgi:geranylgeranyl diphosphate synthase type II